MQNLKEIYYSSNLNPIPNPDLLFLSALALAEGVRCSLTLAYSGFGCGRAVRVLPWFHLQVTGEWLDIS